MGASSALPWVQAGLKRPSRPPHQLPCRRSVLAPTAVRLALRSREGSQTELHAAGAAVAGAGEGGSGAAPTQQQHADGGAAAGAGAGAAGAAAAAAATKGPGGSRKKSGSWWRRLYRKMWLQWGDYQIGAAPRFAGCACCSCCCASLLRFGMHPLPQACTPHSRGMLPPGTYGCRVTAAWLCRFHAAFAEQLPPGCKPILVFVNTKSGPQVGAFNLSMDMHAYLTLHLLLPASPLALGLPSSLCHPRLDRSRLPRAGGRVAAPPLPARPAPAPGVMGPCSAC